MIGINGEFGLVFGTSASSPVTGSLITLINDARLARGKRSVGFINPAVCAFVWHGVGRSADAHIDLLNRVCIWVQRHHDGWQSGLQYVLFLFGVGCMLTCMCRRHAWVHFVRILLFILFLLVAHIPCILQDNWMGPRHRCVHYDLRRP